MTKIEKLRNLVYDFFEQQADLHGENIDRLIDVLSEIDFSYMYQHLARDMEPIYRYQTENADSLIARYRSSKLLPKSGYLVYQEEEHGSELVDIMDSRLFWELWLLEDMTFAVTTCYQTTYDEADHKTEYREYMGNEWPSEHIPIDLEYLLDAMVLFPAENHDTMGFIYMSPEL